MKALVDSSQRIEMLQSLHEESLEVNQTKGQKRAAAERKLTGLVVDASKAGLSALGISHAIATESDLKVKPA